MAGSTSKKRPKNNKQKSTTILFDQCFSVPTVTNNSSQNSSHK